ncbi:hypothetical protein GCM10010340_30140 [Streptomyces griseoloalbus]|nr:hypothetical protein GCM10010340_30140 [Streptomyces albaduncus]
MPARSKTSAALPGDLGTGGAQGCAPGGGAVPDDEGRSGAGEVERHGPAHDAESDETHVHAAPPFPGRAEAPLPMTVVIVAAVMTAVIG